MWILVIFGIFVIFYLIKTYLKFKPFFDLQKKTAHANWAIFKLIGCNPKNFYEMLSDIFKNHETFWMLGTFNFIANDPDDIRAVLNSESIEKRFITRELFSQHGLLFNHEDYKSHRKILNPLFQPSLLRQNVAIINREVGKLLVRYEEKFDGNRVDAKEIAFKYVNRTIGPTLFGIQKELDDDTMDSLRNDIVKGIELMSTRMFKPWTSINFGFGPTKFERELESLTHDLFVKVLDCEPKELYEQPEPDQKYFFGLLKKIPMKIGDFLNSTLFFTSASSETTIASLASTLFLLAINSNAQNKLYNELMSVLKSPQDHVDESHIDQMPYLDLVIKESLRLLPVALILNRKVIKPLKLKKYTLPVGTVVIVPMLETQIDRKLWGSDALEFKPERFEKENFEKIHPYAYFPFSNGLRKCPGIKHALITMKIFLSRFLMKYKISTDMKYADLEYFFEITTRTQQNMMITVEKRS